MGRGVFKVRPVQPRDGSRAIPPPAERSDDVRIEEAQIRHWLDLADQLLESEENRRSEECSMPARVA